MRAFPILMAAALLASCTTASAPPATSQESYYVRDGMVEVIDPAANAIWNIQVDAMDDYGNLDPAKMDGAHWSAIEDAARKLDAEAHRTANAGSYIVADPASTRPPPPEGTDMAAIQARLTANEAGYRSFGRALALHTGKMVEAARARDAQSMTRLANDLQPMCKSCHDVFWYPEPL